MEWVALARSDEPVSKYWSLWWTIIAKPHRTETFIEEIVAGIVKSKDLSTLVPFSDNLKARDITELNPPVWMTMVHKKELPRCYAEALWRKAVAQAKRDHMSLIIFLEQLSASLSSKLEKIIIPD